METIITKAFLSSSFLKKDQRVVEKIKKILESNGIQCFQGLHPSRITEDIIQNIQDCELYCAILTPLDGLAVSPSVSFEIGVALSHNKKSIIFRQEPIPVQSMYSNRLQYPFNRERLLNDDPKETTNIDATVKDLLKQYGYGDMMPESIKSRYKFAKEQAQVLGATVLRYYNDIFYPNQIRDYNAKNYPTEADIHANNIMKNAIALDRIFGSGGEGDLIISEEEIKNPEKIKTILRENSCKHIWVIDPLDGTLNFAYKFPFFGVSIGLIKDGEPVFGVIFNPTTQEIYCGGKYTHSECLDLKSGTKKLLTSNSSKKELKDCIMMTHLSSKEDARSVTINLLNDMMACCRNIRMLGSGQMAMVSIAMRQFDIFFNYSTNIWDVVPAGMILQGAGGYITTSLREPNKWDFESKGVLAACNEEIGEKIREILKEKIRGDFPQL